MLLGGVNPTSHVQWGTSSHRLRVVRAREDGRSERHPLIDWSGRHRHGNARSRPKGWEAAVHVSPAVRS